jgi:hypothetical protein
VCRHEREGQKLTLKNLCVPPPSRPDDDVTTPSPTPTPRASFDSDSVVDEPVELGELPSEDSDPEDHDPNSSPTLIDGFNSWRRTEEGQGCLYSIVSILGLIVIIFVLYWIYNGIVHPLFSEVVAVVKTANHRLSKNDDERRYACFALGIIGFCLVLELLRQRKIRRGVKPLPILLIGLAFLAILAVTGVTAWLLFREAAAAPVDARPGLRSEAIRTAITLFAGSSGAAVLVLSFRNHFTSETDRLNNQLDTAIQKLTDQSIVVQLGGLFALERIAIKHPAYRRAAKIVIGAYSAPTRQASELANDILKRL